MFASCTNSALWALVSQRRLLRTTGTMSLSSRLPTARLLSYVTSTVASWIVSPFVLPPVSHTYVLLFYSAPYVQTGPKLYTAETTSDFRRHCMYTVSKKHDIFSSNLSKHFSLWTICWHKMLPEDEAIISWFIFPPHLNSVSALPCNTESNTNVIWLFY